MTHLEDLVREAFLEHETEAPDGAGLLDSVHERLAAPRRRGRTVTALVAAFVVVAIVATVAAVAGTHRRSEAPATVAPQPTAPAPTTPTPSPTTTVQSTTTSQPIPAECVRPVAGVYNGVYDIREVPALNGPTIDYLKSRFGDPAYSANGITIRYPSYPPDTVLRIDRPDGTVGLRGAHIAALDDFDGDGRIDLVVEILDGSDKVSYIVPGSVAVGTHDVAAVGIRLPAAPPTADNFTGDWFPVGDQNGDGADDLMINDRLYSGRQLMDATPGGALAALPAPFRTLPQALAGVLQLHPTGPPTIIEIVGDGSALVFDDGGRQRLTGLDARVHSVRAAVRRPRRDRVQRRRSPHRAVRERRSRRLKLLALGHRHPVRRLLNRVVRVMSRVRSDPYGRVVDGPLGVRR